MALSRIKTWASGEVLTAAELNTEFNNILTNALSLINPLTGNLDLDGNEFILDSDADTSISADTDDRVDFKLGGTDIFRFNTVATAVNGIDFYGSSTGNQPYIRCRGTDTNFGFDIRDSNANEIIVTDGVASAVNEIKVTNAATTNAPDISATGDDTNIGITVTPKGTGALDLTSGAFNENKSADIASATTTDIGAATGNFIDVTGTTTITGLGTVKEGSRRIVQFDGALTLTYNATSLILPGNANISVKAGDIAEFVSLGSGNWMMVNYLSESSIPLIETGTWTPTIQDNSLSDAEGQTYTAQGGFYTKIGNRVLIHGFLNVSSLGTLTGGAGANIGGLPFTSSSTANSDGSIFAGGGGGLVLPTAGDVVSGVIVTNTNYIQLQNWTATTGSTALTITQFGTGNIYFSGQYIV